jgi:hypothetical protein
LGVEPAKYSCVQVWFSLTPRFSGVEHASELDQPFQRFCRRARF